MDNIKSYKVATGEEVIGRVENETDEIVTMTRMRVVVMQPMQGGQLGVGFMPFMVSNLGDQAPVYLQKRAIVGEQNPSREIRDAYIKNTTGIEIAAA